MPFMGYKKGQKTKQAKKRHHKTKTNWGQGLGLKAYDFKRTCSLGVLNAQTVVGGVPTVLTVESYQVPSTQVSWVSNTVLASLAGDPLSNTAQFQVIPVFRLSDIAQPSDITTLFDQYKLHHSILEIEMINANLGTVSGFGQIPMLDYIYDYDDITPLADIDAYCQRGSHKSFKLEQSKVLRIYCKPKQSVVTYKTSGTTIGYSNVPSEWIDSSYPDVEHYALKLHFSNFPTYLAQQCAIRMTMTHYIQGRSTI